MPFDDPTSRVVVDVHDPMPISLFVVFVDQLESLLELIVLHFTYKMIITLFNKDETLENCACHITWYMDVSLRLNMYSFVEKSQTNFREENRS